MSSGSKMKLYTDASELQRGVTESTSDREDFLEETVQLSL